MDNKQLTGSYLAERPALLVYVALSGALAVALGAFGAHALDTKLVEARAATYQTAVLYHFIHTLAMLAVIQLSPKPLIRWAVTAFALGLVLFCGSLYLLATRGLIGLESASWLGAITPLGGLSFIAGWILLALSARRMS